MNLLWSMLGVAVCILSASTSNALAQQDTNLHPPGAHGPVAGKPSAQVELVDPTPVELRPGEVQSVTVKLKTAYSQGQMRVQVSAAEPLEVLGEQSSFLFDLAEGGPYSLPLELYLPVPGRHYLGLAVELDSPETPINSRALAVIVNGGKSKLTAPLLERPTAPGGGTRIHSLPALERVTPAKTPAK